MTLYFRLFGGGLLVLSAVLASLEYSRYADLRLLHYSSLASLFDHAGGMISKFLLKGDELWRSFRNEALEKIGLIDRLREGESLSSAFEKCENSLALSKETKEKIKKILASAGREYRNGAAEAYLSIAKWLEEEKNSEKERLNKSVKVTRALLIGGALAFLILII